MDDYSLLYIIAACFVLAALSFLVGMLFSMRKNKVSQGKGKLLKDKIITLQNDIDANLSEISSLHDKINELTASANADRVSLSKKEALLKVSLDKNQQLTEELEDANEDLRTMERRVRNLSNERNRLNDELLDGKRTLDAALSSLDEAQKRLKKNTSELIISTDALSFVQEILTAKPVSTDSVIEKELKINSFCSFINTNFKKLYTNTISDNPPAEVFGEGLSQWAVVKRKTWIEGKRTIAFIGEFSAGKTSIVNRILSPDNPSIKTLPVETRPTTAIPTYIAGGDCRAFRFFSPEGELKEIKESVFRMVDKEVLEKIKGVKELIKYFVMTDNNPSLMGLSILDTPGFGSGDEEDTKNTIDVINECDALFWVMDVTDGDVVASALKTINTIRAHLTRPLYVVINKTDLPSKSQVDSVEEQIRATFQENGIEVKAYLRYNHKMPINEIVSAITSVEKVSSAELYFVTLRQTLKTILQNCKGEVDAAEIVYKEAKQKCSSTYQTISRLCDTISNDCDTAYKIPQWKTYYLRKNRYEMDANSGSKLKTILDSISRVDSKDIKKALDEYGVFMRNRDVAYQTFIEKENILRQFESCELSLENMIQDVNF